MKVLAKFYWDCGRQGSVDGLFVTTKEKINAAIGKNIYFGEILGKHSDVQGVLEAADIQIVSDDQEFISKLVDILGSPDVSGHNPLDYLEE